MPGMRKIEFYVPEAACAKVADAMFAAGAGALGRYDHCCWTTVGQGQFRPLPGSDPHIGCVDRIERTPEVKVEMICPDERIEEVVAALIRSHPYETPAFQHWPVETTGIKK